MKFTIDSNGCWNFTGSINQGGYGRVKLKKQEYLAHRLMAHLTIRPLSSETQVVAHKCDNPCCINPEHLFITTNAGNMADRDEKGRMSRGDTHPNSKLTINDILEIRSLYESGISQAQISKKFNVCQPSICAIVNRKTWKHV